MDATLFFALSSGLPQIVGLLATFLSIDNDKKNLAEFKEWLIETNNEYAIKIIENSNQLQDGLSVLMNANHNENMAKLSQITNLIINMANKMENSAKLASSYSIGAELSEQAISVLRQFVESGSPKIRHMKLNDGRGYPHLYLLEGTGEKIHYNEPNFIEGDIESLVNRSLITQTFGSKGGKIYNITRQAAAFIKTIDN